ncbi:hypothetical protein C0Q70_04089 [Pomacea canaliculata]|uniref:CARD domain-containing protein n=1 Tax=Pomacea canaliculata TaxID=400727 RepID=A0A2T7PUJ4_POMCA|nr:hypothetical protein C0Q70_04089 [Pomacea canaliculata]
MALCVPGDLNKNYFQTLTVVKDKAAAAMLTEPLSGRRNLVEGLDAKAILDYLTQHGVLDADTVQSLRSTDSMTQRNASLLQRVEEEGHNAVALFINALRQSGQLHLASSLDNTQRIKPMSGSGYWEKQRHKGQVTIQIKVNKFRIVVPERDTHGDVIDASMLASPQRHGLDLDQHHHQSYENMELLESPDLAIQRSVRIYDYPYSVDDEEERPVGKKSFFCFCFPRAAKKKKSKEKKYLEQQELKLKRSFQPNPRDNEDVSRDSSGMKVDKNKRVRSPEKDIHARISSSQGETGEVTLGGDYRRN